MCLYQWLYARRCGTLAERRCIESREVEIGIQACDRMLFTMRALASLLRHAVINWVVKEAGPHPFHWESKLDTAHKEGGRQVVE
jgi:hypothetical protein